MNFFKNKVKQNEEEWNRITKENGNLKKAVEELVKSIEKKPPSSEIANLERRVHELETQLAEERAERSALLERLRREPQSQTNLPGEDDKAEQFARYMQEKFENFMANLQEQVQQFIQNATKEIQEFRSGSGIQYCQTEPASFVPSKKNSVAYLHSKKPSFQSQSPLVDTKEYESPRTRLKSEHSEPKSKPAGKSPFTTKLTLDSVYRSAGLKTSIPSTGTSSTLRSEITQLIMKSDPKKETQSKPLVSTSRPMTSPRTEKAEHDLARSTSPKVTMPFEYDPKKGIFNESTSGKSESRNDSTNANTKDDIQVNTSGQSAQKTKKKSNTMTNFQQIKEQVKLKQDTFLSQFKKK